MVRKEDYLYPIDQDLRVVNDKLRCAGRLRGKGLGRRLRLRAAELRFTPGIEFAAGPPFVEGGDTKWRKHPREQERQKNPRAFVSEIHRHCIKKQAHEDRST